MNLGIRAHDIEGLSLEELVKVISDKGLFSVQLALSKSFEYIRSDIGKLSPGLAHYISSTFNAHNIQIAVLGCYINMIHPNSDERKAALERFKEHIRFARNFGCSIVGTETGNVNAEIVYTEENFKEGPFQQVVNSVKELVLEAERFGVMVGIEGGVNHPVYSPKVMRRLLDNIESNNLQVIYDPVNYLTIENYRNQTAVIEEAFDLFGDRIVVFHAKDFVIDNNIIKTVPIGQGMLDYGFIFKLLKKRKPFINILMEETKEPFIDKSVSFLKKKYNDS